MKIGKTFTILFLALLYLILPLRAEASYSRVFSSDDDFSQWSLTNIEANGSDSGIRLSEKEDGGYERSGEATYKFTPGGTNNWLRATIDGDNATSISSKYLWAAVFNRNSVSQIDTETREIVKEWDVGGDPSRTAIGCDNDAWVGNRYSNSISHIIPGEDRVITRTIDGGNIFRTPRAVSIQCGSGDEDDYVYVGASGYVAKFSAQDFDNLPKGGKITDIQQGNTLSLSVPNVAGTHADDPRYITYGSAFDSSGRYLYVASKGRYIAGVGDNNHTLVFKIDTTKFDQAGYSFEPGWPVNSGYYIINNDDQSHIWRDTHCIRISSDGSTKELCSNSAGIGIATIPNHPDGTDKLAYIKNIGGVRHLVVNNLLNNNTDNPSLSNFSQTPMIPAGIPDRTVDSPPQNISGGGLGYDEDYDIWFLPRKATWIAEFKASENYSTAHYVKASNKQNGAVYSYSDFIGNALSNTIPAQTDVSYSINGTDYYSANTDGSLPSQITPSQDLYIKVKMTGSGTNSPLLRSLTVEYDPESQGDLQIVRKTYTSSSARDFDKSESTFDKGETVYVRIILFQPDAESGTSLIDRLSNFTDSRNYRYKVGCSGEGSIVSPIFSATNELKFNINIPSGLSCIDYEYTAE